MTGQDGKDPTLADGVRRVLAHRGDGPLREVLVVELTHSLAGNFAGTLLADFGACVIKAEPRDGGDPLRRLGTVPPQERDSLYFQAECRGKYSILFDPPADVPALTALLGASDLLIEDYGPGWLESHDLDPQALWRDNPSLNLLRLSAFGQTGPLRNEAGDDRVAQAFAGVTNVTGYPGQPPIPVSVPLAEYWTGLHGANGALIALLEAAGSGRGQVIDLGLYETALRVQEEAVIQHDQLGIVRRRMGNEYAETVPSNHYETADGRWVAISAAGIAPFRRVCEAIGDPEAADDPVYSTPDARIQNRGLVNELIGSWVGRHTVDEVAERFTAAGAPFAMVKSSAEIAEDPQVLARGNLLDCPSQSGRASCVLAPVPKVTGHEMSLRGGGPEHGEHDQAVRSVLDGSATSTARSDNGSATPSSESESALSGLRVIDLGQFIAAPFLATQLAEFGAETIKVELPHGDHTRQRFPEKDGVGLAFLITNRNKLSITLDLHHERARDVLLDLVRVSDVLVENFRPGTLERFGIGPEALHAANPRLVVARLSGFGQTGPAKDRSAFDRIGLATGGFSYLGGRPDSPPLRPGVLASDYSSGLFGLLGVLVALYGREHGDTGQVIDGSLYEAILRMTGDTLPLWRNLGVIRERDSARWPLYPMAATHPSKDGRSVTVSAPVGADPNDLMARLGVSATTDSSSEETLSKWIASHDSHEAVSKARAANFAASLVNSVEDIAVDPHIQERENIVTVQHHQLGPVRMQGVVPRLSRTPGTVRGYSQEAGSDNQAIYHELLGYSPQDIDQMRTEGVI